MNKRFEFLEHTADSKFKAYGDTLEEGFENAALATFETMIDTSKVKGTTTREINLKAKEKEDLLYQWISELIYLFSANNIVFSKFEVKITKNDEYNLKGTVYGEKIDLSRHILETEVKAITYHNLEIKKNKQYEIIALLDI